MQCRRNGSTMGVAVGPVKYRWGPTEMVRRGCRLEAPVARLITMKSSGLRCGEGRFAKATFDCEESACAVERSAGIPGDDMP